MCDIEAAAPKLLTYVVALSSLVRIWGERSTIHSLPALFFFFFGGGEWRLACAH